jgi:anti-sigma factor RsiW
MIRPAEALRRRGPMCEHVARFLPAYVAEEETLDSRTLAHVAECLRCQAEIARYRRMLRTLHGLRLDREAAPASLLSSVIAGLDRPPGARRAWLLVAGLVSATGAVAATATILWLGHRDALGAQLGQATAMRLRTSRVTTNAITTV